MPNLLRLLQGFEEVSILVTYRSDNFNIQEFIEEITRLLTFHRPDLVLDGFNINSLKDSVFLETIRQYGYTLLGTEPTYIMGRLLNHVTQPV